MGYSYNAERAHQQWLDWAKQKSTNKLTQAVITSNNPALQQTYGQQLANTIEGRFGTGAAIASGLINAGSNGLYMQNRSLEQQRFENLLKERGMSLDENKIGSEISNITALNAATINKYGAESETEKAKASQANYLTQFFKDNPDILKKYYESRNAYLAKPSHADATASTPEVPASVTPSSTAPSPIDLGEAIARPNANLTPWEDYDYKNYLPMFSYWGQ